MNVYTCKTYLKTLIKCYQIEWVNWRILNILILSESCSIRAITQLVYPIFNEWILWDAQVKNHVSSNKLSHVIDNNKIAN